MVTELLTKELLPMLVMVLAEPLILTPAKVLRVFPNETELEPIVMELLTNAEFGMLVSVLVEPLIDLLVNVCAPAKVATVESIAIVTAVEPL